MRGRPDVDLKLPASAHPGDEIDVTIAMDSASDTPIDFIDLTFTGEEILSLQLDGDQRRQVRPLLEVKQRLREPGVLTEGKHQFRARFRLPADAPASYLGLRIQIRYEVRLRVAIPWWPDLDETYELLVEPRNAVRPPPRPANKVSGAGSQPFIELSLADTHFAVNDEISGAFAVGNVPRGGGEGIEIALVGIESADVNGFVRRGEQFRYIVPTVFRTPKNGGEVPFRFRVPKGVSPSFKTAWCDLSWGVQAALRVTWSSATSCLIPVEIGAHPPSRDASKSRPEIGAARWRRVWSAAGEPAGLALKSDRLVLHGTRGEVQIEIAADASDEDEPALTATLRYPSLDLDLKVTKKLLLLLPTALELRFPGYKIECREHDQCMAFFDKPLRDALLAFTSMAVTDTRVTVGSPGAAHDPAVVSAFVQGTLALAQALDRAMEHMPPPAAMKDALPAWRDFASATEGRLAPGGMALLSATFDGGLFDITTRWGERAAPTGTRIDLQIEPPLSYSASLAEPATFESAPPGSLELARALASSSAEVQIQPHALSVMLDGPTPDPAELRPRMVEMLMLARRLRGERTPGPYR